MTGASVEIVGRERDERVALIGHVTVEDQSAWARYCEGVPETLEAWGGKVLFRGRVGCVFEGAQDFATTVVIAFPSAARLIGWYTSEAYAPLKALRQAAARSLVMGCGPGLEQAWRKLEGAGHHQEARGADRGNDTAW